MTAQAAPLLSEAAPAGDEMRGDGTPLTTGKGCPAMSTTLKHEPKHPAHDAGGKSTPVAIRQAAASSPRSSKLEMPVLFQLADLSRLKVTIPSTTAVENNKRQQPPAVTLQEKIGATDKESSTAVVPPVQKETSQGKPRTDEKTLEKNTTASPPKEAEKPVPSPLPSSKSEKPATSEIASATVVAIPMPISPAPPENGEALSLRQRAQQRERKRQTEPAKRDWMSSHGKLIAIGFVLALIVTIYLARRNRQSASPSKPADVASDLNVEMPPETAAESTPAPELASEVANDGSRSPAPLFETTHPSAAAESSSEPHTQLQLPIAADQPANPPAAASDSKDLFPWKEKGEPRMASRPEAPAAEETRENPGVYAPSVQPVNDPPAEKAPSNPQTTPSGKSEPALNAPYEYPVTSPTSYRDFGAADGPSRTAARPASAPGGAMPASYQNQTPPPRNNQPRYERTGSGLY